MAPKESKLIVTEDSQTFAATAPSSSTASALEFVTLEEFGNLRFYVDRRDCEVRVTMGCKGDRYETERQAAIEISKDELRRLRMLLEGDPAGPADEAGAASDKYYTYVALFYKVLMVRRIRRSTGEVTWKQTVQEHHSTLMYLPFQWPTWRDGAQLACNEWLSDWFDTPPAERPRKLLTSRKVHLLCTYEELRHQPQVLRSRHEHWPGTELYDYGKEDLGFMEQYDLDEHLKKGSLRPAKMPDEIARDMEQTGSLLPNKLLLDDFCIRIWRRDQLRLREARAMESLCTPRRAYAHKAEVYLSDCVVRPDCELFTLLHYLQQLMVFRFRAYHLLPRKDIGILTGGQWHITPVEAWDAESGSLGKVAFARIPPAVATGEFQRQDAAADSPTDRKSTRLASIREESSSAPAMLMPTRPAPVPP